VLRPEVGKVVAWVLAAAAAIVAIVSYLTPFVGVAIAAIIVGILIVAAIFVGLWSRPPRDTISGPAPTLPPTSIPERPPEFGFLKWREFRRALDHAREVTVAEVEAEGLDAMGEGRSPSISMTEVLRRLEARRREVYERFGFRSKAAESKPQTVQPPGSATVSAPAASPAFPTRAKPMLRREPPQEPNLTAMLTRGVRNVCFPGPFDVSPARPARIPISVDRGLTLVGTLEEEDGYDFDWAIMDEDNWVKSQQGEEFTTAAGDEGEAVYKVNWKVRPGGPWFLILYVYGKQLVREVHVNLRLSAGP
jgi:hypothetical protein